MTVRIGKWEMEIPVFGKVPRTNTIGASFLGGTPPHILVFEDLRLIIGLLQSGYWICVIAS